MLFSIHVGPSMLFFNFGFFTVPFVLSTQPNGVADMLRVIAAKDPIVKNKQLVRCIFSGSKIVPYEQLLNKMEHG